jgi:subtilisin family serine protease
MPVWSVPTRLRLWLGVLLALACLEAASNSALGPASLPGGQPAPFTLDEATVRDRAECLSILGVDRWHRMGFRGQGCKIAVLDSGFRGYRDFLGKGLPEQVVAKSFRIDANLEARESQHGILCGEVIHTLAPGADLLFANWEPDDPASFLSAVRWAKLSGARIISCSLIMPNWSDGEGGGQVHSDLARLLGAGHAPRDLLCFACAGNTALRHWTGFFQPNEQGLHQWGPGRTVNLLRPWGLERVAVEIYGPTRMDCELQVLDEVTGALIGKAALQADGAEYWGRAVVRFDPLPGRNYLVRLQCMKRKEEKADKFHLVALGGNLDYYTTGGSIPFPGDGAHVVAVGAVDRFGKRLSYSSCGPNSSCPKPDFVGLVPFPSLCRQRPFAGTSAAAPEAAALAALCWSRNPQSTPQQIRAALQKAALDLCAPGHDCETGYGLIRLP